MRTRLPLRRIAVALAAAALAAVPAAALGARGDDPAGLAGIPDPNALIGGPEWTSAGHDLADTRSQPFDRLLAPYDVASLAPRWVVTTAGDVSATPAVAGGAVYFPDWGGKLWKVDARTGAVVWSRSISDYTGIAGGFSRTTPAVDGDTLYIGDQGGSHVMAIDARTGALRWIAQVDPNRWSLITASPLVVGNLLLVGTSSQENVQRIDPCCIFRGSLTAFDKRSGRVVWRTYTVPDNGGQYGQFAT